MASIIEVQETKLRTIWEPDELATPDLIDALLDDMGFERPEVRHATREQAKEVLTWGEITMGYLNTMLSSFAEGYEVCERQIKCQS